MNTRHLLAGGVLALGAVTAGAGTRHALAQQGAATAPPALVVNCDSMKSRANEAGRGYETTLQVHVEISRAGGPVALTAGPDALTLGVGDSGKGPQTIRIPMDRATLRVTVTPSGTIFEDQHGDKLTVKMGASPN